MWITRLMWVVSSGSVRIVCVTYFYVCRKEFTCMSDTYRLKSVLSRSSVLLDEEVSVSEGIRIMITVTKVFSSSNKKLPVFIHNIYNKQLGVCIREYFDMLRKAWGPWNLMVVQFLKCLFFFPPYFVFNWMLLI